MPIRRAAQQLAAPVLLVGLSFALLGMDVVAQYDVNLRISRLILEAIAAACAVIVLIRTVRRTRFSREIGSMLRRIRSGDSTRRFYFQHAFGPEDRGVALAFSEAMKSVYRRFESVLQERMREEAIIASMAEGVVVVDRDERVTRMNEAASELLAAAPRGAVGRTLQEVVRNAEMQRFVGALLRGERPEERDIELRGGTERYLQMTGRELKDIEGSPGGGIIVLTDVTRLRRLERTRSDFIANVSHELKTPVTSIRGFAETLLDGALDNPDDARRFLGIISRQADRLCMIFDDMLALSRLEQENQVELQPAGIEGIIKGAIQSCELKAATKKISIELACQRGLKGFVNPAFLEQAVLNLIDNAIKYSPEGSSVKVSADKTEGRIFISVHDNGPGIESVHLPRIFERFYRIDKGRSRTEGGTGLGLAIVKHIAQIHGGHATVDSSPGEGSTFTIFLKPPAVDEIGPARKDA